MNGAQTPNSAATSASTTSTTSTTPLQPQPAPQSNQTVATAPPQVTPTPEDVQKVCPDSDINNIRKNLPIILKAMAKAGLTTKEDLVAVIATIYTETRGFASIPEVGKGGGEHGIYYGRGFVQLTHDYNYKAFGKVIGIDLLSNPDKALDPEIAAQATVWFFTSNGLPAYARRGDYDNLRSILNAGAPGRVGSCWGMEVYRPAIQRGLQVFKSGIDPKAVGAMPLDGNYGLGCVDPGAGGNRTISSINPQTQADALIHAMGLSLAARGKAIEFRARVDPAAEPKVLDLDAQKTFELKGVGKGLDGTYTTEDVIFWLDGNLEVEITAFQPDPNAPPAQVFAHNTNQAGATGGTTTPIPAGEIPAKIFAAATAARGRSTADGPGNGNVACAYAVNNFCLLPAGLPAIGSNPNYVPSMVEALDGGRGQKIAPAQSGPGDIWISYDMAHVGICMTAGCTTVLSNSSSKARFAWEDSRGNVDTEYGGPTQAIYRVVK